MGFNFSSGADGIRIGGARESLFGSTTDHVDHGNHGDHGDDNASNIGYRGKGYNANFAHADEYPPMQGPVQIQRTPLDLNAMANKQTRRHYVTNDKRHIYAMMLERNGVGNRLKRGISKDVALICKCPRRVVQRVWKEAKKGGGITSVKNNKKLKCGRKKIELNIDALEAIPPGQRTTLEQVAGHMNLSRTTVWRRLRGAWELKPADSVDRNKSREYLVKYVLPAIKEKWPESDRWNTIYVQQDNARTHILPDDPVFMQEAARGGWDIKMIYQPPNSPDLNILDLGWFASIQAMFHKKMPKTLAEIVQKVNESLAEYPHLKLNRIWLSHQACMREIIKHKGSIHYEVPHLRKQALERQGNLPVRLNIDKEYVEAAIDYLNSA
ncbi:hypothetical protein D1007_01298 [Hordeum vulgare]|nr:hypothetical protein D1007_01298 [Hordeum vulgare]